MNTERMDHERSELEAAHDELTEAIAAIERAAKNPALLTRLNYWLSESRFVMDAIIDRAAVNESFRRELKSKMAGLGETKFDQARSEPEKHVIASAVETEHYRLARLHKAAPKKNPRPTREKARAAAADKLGLTVDQVRNVWDEMNPNRRARAKKPKQQEQAEASPSITGKAPLGSTVATLLSASARKRS